MGSYRVGMIGLGRAVRPDGKPRLGMAYNHAAGYLAHPEAEIVALADIKRDNAVEFNRHHKLKAAIYEDYRQMLADERLDIVSICTWPALHCEMTVACAEAGVKAVHCEKPMATCWGGAQRMAAACEKAGTQLTFGHQRRFGPPFRKARELAWDGTIGELRRLEGECSNLYDWGTHWFDMFFFYNREEPAEWVLAQIDKRGDKQVFGVPLDEQGVCRLGFANGVQGYLETGEHSSLGVYNRLIGTTGVAEVGVTGGSALRYRNATSTGWVELMPRGELHGGENFKDSIADLIACLHSGDEPELAARKALQATEVIFAAYESSRRRGRVDLPLEQQDNALLAMLEEGLIGPQAR